VARPTSTLVRLHVEQGYLERARSMLDELGRRPGSAPIAELEALWSAAAARRRREARIDALRRLLAGVRKQQATRGGARWAR
jgi:hypothetical protein